MSDAANQLHFLLQLHRHQLGLSIRTMPQYAYMSQHTRPVARGGVLMIVSDVSPVCEVHTRWRHNSSGAAPSTEEPHNTHCSDVVARKAHKEGTAGLHHNRTATAAAETCLTAHERHKEGAYKAWAMILQSNTALCRACWLICVAYKQSCWQACSAVHTRTAGDLATHDMHKAILSESRHWC